MDERMSDAGPVEDVINECDKTMTEAEPAPTLSIIDDYEQIAEKELAPQDEETVETKVFHWDIENYKDLPERVQGPVFEVGGHKWNILLFPRGNNQNELLSVYLEYAELRENPSPDVYACAQFVIALSPPSDPTRFVSQVSHRRFCAEETDWGFTRFMDLRRIYQGDAQTGTAPFIENDSLRISVIVRVIADETGVLWHNFINYDSKKMTGYVGMKNQGATCYMNSLFQSLYCTNYFRKAVYQIPTENDDPNNSIALALQRLFYNLQFNSNSVGTTELTRSFGWTSSDAFMQHDVQEFNRVLQDALEAKMKDTPADGAIKKLFLGKMKSYIKCINVDYESSRSEDYYDIQLNVKGCKNLEESFKDYIAEETLEGDNKYMAEGHGLQDAKKGVIFEDFPPVLHLQLKRFEYDMMRDTMIKINDRHEFPLEIDLEPFLDSNADKSQPHKYALHGVLVHSGDLSGGHYFAFVKPTKDGRWLRFDDDRVTPATLKEVLEENYGGEPLNGFGMGRPAPRVYKRFTNAYMLVYIRESMRDEILGDVSENDIPPHLIKRIEEERIAREKRNRERAEQHLYMRVVLATDESFEANTGFDFVRLDDRLRVEDTHVQTLRVRKDQTYGEFMQELAESTGVQVGHFRLWLLVNRQNRTIRPDQPLSDSPEELELTMEKLQEKYVTDSQNTLRLYMETAKVIEDDVPAFPPPSTANGQSVLVFIKLFDPKTQLIRGVGHVYAPCNGKVSSITEELNMIAGFEPETPLRLFEEIKPTMIEEMDQSITFNDAEIQDGDIICIQQQLSDEEIIALKEQGLYSTVPEYMDYQNNKLNVLFVPRDKDPNGEVALEMHKNTKYDDVSAKLAEKIGADPDKIQFFVPNTTTTDEPRHPYARDPNDTLESMLYTQRLGRPFVNGKLFYEVLDVSLAELESKRLITVTTCIPTLKDGQTSKLWISKQARITDLLKELQIGSNPSVRVFEAINNRFHREFMSTDALAQVSDSHAAQLYIEPIPEEERNMGDEDFFIRVFHFQHNQHRTHSVPFKFLVRKDEPFEETKKRLQARTGMADKEWSKVKFSIVSQYSAAPIDEDDYKLSDHQFNREDSLGLEHIDRTKTNRSGFEKGLSIRA